MSTFSTHIHTLTIKIVWQFNKNHDDGSKNIQRLWQSMALTILFYEELFLQLIKFFHQSPYLNFLTCRGSLSTMPTTISMGGKEAIKITVTLATLWIWEMEAQTNRLSCLCTPLGARTLPHSKHQPASPPPGANHIVGPVNIFILPPPPPRTERSPICWLQCFSLVSYFADWFFSYMMAWHYWEV